MFDKGTTQLHGKGARAAMMAAAPASDWLKDRLGDQRGGSEWEPIKILLKGDRNSDKTN
jgi:hypothetical protein